MATFEAFKNQQYLNLETFRKNGQGVKTPVWFVEYAGQLVVSTESSSGKVKRLRNNPAVRVAPCKMDGTVIGDWQPANARLMKSEETGVIEKLINRKYGLVKFMFELPSLFKKRPERSFIAIQSISPDPQ